MKRVATECLGLGRVPLEVDAVQYLVESGVGAEWIKSWIDFHISHPLGALFASAFQAIKGFLLPAQVNVDPN